MQKILHIADLHLGFEHKYLGSHSAQRAEEAVQTLERIVDLVLDETNRIEAVLIAGDLFETHDPDPLLTGRVVSTLKRITSSERTLVTVPGNHDEYSYPQSIYRSHHRNWPGTLVTNPQPGRVTSFKLDNQTVSVYSMAYTAGLSPRRVRKLIESTHDETSTRGDAADDEIRIALLHGTLDADPSDRSFRIDSDAFQQGGFSYAALGHQHRPSNTRFGDCVAVYPGILCGKGFHDPGTDQLVVAGFPGGRPVVDKIPFPVRPVETRKLDLSQYQTQEQLVADLEREGQSNLIIRFELIGPKPADLDLAHLCGRLRDSYFHLELEDHSIEISVEEMSRLQHQPTIKGIFTELIHQKMNENQHDPKKMETYRVALIKGLTAFETINRQR